MRAPLLLPLSLVLLASCGPHTDTTSSKSGPTQVTAPTATASAAAAAPPAGDGTMPAAPAGVDAELFRFAASICPVVVLPDLLHEGKQRVGCGARPVFPRPDFKPDGKIITEMDQLEMCSIDAVYRGSFTKAGAKQAALVFSQCKLDDSTWDMGNPGSVVIVEEAGDRWKAVLREHEVNADRCKTYKTADGRDALACQDSFSALGDFGLAWLMTIDFTRPEGKRAERFAKMFYDDFPITCQSDFSLPQWFDYGLFSVRVKGLEITDVNKDGKADVVVTVARAGMKASKESAKKVEAACKKKKDGEMLMAEGYMPKPVEHKLEFYGDGNKFAPSPATEKKLDGWKAETTFTNWNIR